MSKDAFVLPRSVSLKEGDWVTLGEQLGDLRTAVERLSKKGTADAQNPTGWRSATLATSGRQLSVDLDSGTAHEFALIGRGNNAAVNIQFSNGGTVTWTSMQFTTSLTRSTGSGSTGTLLNSGSSSFITLRGVVGESGSGSSYTLSGSLNTTVGLLAFGQSTGKLGSSLQFGGTGLAAGSKLFVRSLGG